MASSFIDGWEIGSLIASYFSKEDKTDAILIQMNRMVDASIEAETIEETISILEKVWELSDKTNCQKKYQQAVLGYVLSKGGYYAALCYWQTHLYDLDAKKDLDEYFNRVLEGCTNVTNIDITIFTDNDDLIRDVRNIASQLAENVKDSRKQIHKHYKLIDKTLHPWKYRLMWLIPLLVILLATIIFLFIVQ